VIQTLSEFGVEEIVIEKTPVACELFNQYYKQKRNVVLAAHGTC
jgi:hypothetical protein